MNYKHYILCWVSCISMVLADTMEDSSTSNVASKTFAGLYGTKILDAIVTSATGFDLSLKDEAKNMISNYVKNGTNNSYGYIVEKNITMPKLEWDDIDKYLVDNYNFTDSDDAKENGFIPFDFANLVEEEYPYYVQPTESYLKQDGTVVKNKINVYDKETALEKNYEAVSKILRDIYKEDLDFLEI